MIPLAIIILVVGILIYLLPAVVFIFGGMLMSSLSHKSGSNELAVTQRTYPYKNRFMTEDELRERFNRLKNYELKFMGGGYEYKVFNVTNVQPVRMLFRGQPMVALVEDANYNLYDNLSDYWLEDVRLGCKRYDQKDTPYEFWQKLNDPEFEKLSVYNQREYLYSKYYECTTFKPSLIVGFAKYLCAAKPKILDISSGWGDRLIGALAVAESYAGADPNNNLFPGYNQIMEFFGADKTKFSIQNTTFQDMVLPDWRPNLVLTSPPYFNLEEYSGAKVTDNLDTWLEKFLRVSMEKASGALEMGGHMVININDSKDEHFVHRMLSFNLPNMVYLGCLGQSQLNNGKLRSVQPFWTWKKVDLPVELNPAVVIDEMEHDGKKFKVVRDDLLLGGTKQRVMKEIFAAHPEGIVYPGPANGYAQIALAVGAKLYNSRAVILLPKIRPMTAQTILASQLGAEIHEYWGEDAKLFKLKQHAEKIAAKEGLYLPKLGFEGDEFKKSLRSALSTSLQMDRTLNYNIWVVGGSGTLALTLLDEFPNSKVNVVQVGKQIDWSFKNQPRAKLVVADEKFYDDARDMPPYPSLGTYDAKVWQFARFDLSENTLIWNVAGEATVF